MSLWRGAAIGYGTRLVSDEGAIATMLARLTEVTIRGVCPRFFELDARVVARQAAQFLKGG